MRSIPQFPNEIIEAVLLHLPPVAQSNESVRTICRVGLGNSRFLAVSRLPHIWKAHYEVRWKRSDAAREQSRKSSGDWWDMYYTRIQLNRRAVHLLDAIISQPHDRNYLAIQLVNDYGYDVWEAFSEEATRVQLSDIEDQGSDMVSEVVGLTRQYWAHEILGVIARCRAVKIWLPLTNPAEDIPFEQGFAALSSFFGADIERIIEEFDGLALDCQEYLRAQGFNEDSNPTETIIQICAWMRQHGFVKTDLTNHHHLLNNFPHSVLFDRQTSLPLAAISLVYVFVCVARRLGFDARPVAFPRIVLAMVTPPAGDAIYVNVFMSATCPILSYTSDLPAMLQMMGLNPDDLAKYASPASTATMLNRAVAFIFNSLSVAIRQKEVDKAAAYSAAHYAAWSAVLFLTGTARILLKLFWDDDIRGPLDLEVVIKNALRPCLTEDTRDELDLRLSQLEEASELYVPKTAGRSRIEYFAGMPIRHIEGEYFGVIKGWNYESRLGDQELDRMCFNDLPSGSNQPCYHILAHDGRTRDVAAENIEPIGRPKACDLVVLIEANKNFGRWFDGVEFTESGAARFTMSSESRVLYPEDDIAGRLFLAEQERCAGKSPAD